MYRDHRERQPAQQEFTEAQRALNEATVFKFTAPGVVQAARDRWEAARVRVEALRRRSGGKN